MENKVFVSNKKAEEFYNSLTEQEKGVVDKMTKKTMKPFFEAQAELQNGLQSAFTKFIRTNKVK